MFANFLSALIGRQRVIYTSLRNLNTDRFETYNLRFKSLINITDAERYEADVPILKQIVGSDPINANAKYVQGSIEIKRLGNLMIVSNHPFKTKDNTAALMRRLVPFKASLPPAAVQIEGPLLSPLDDVFVGPGSEELPGILNWVLGFTESESYNILTHVAELVPTLSDAIMEAKYNINPLSSWVEEHLCFREGKSTQLGLKGSNEGTLYGNYAKFCTQEAISVIAPRRFREDLENYLQSHPLFNQVYTKKTNQGLAMQNVALVNTTTHDCATGDKEGEPPEANNAMSFNNRLTSLDSSNGEPLSSNDPCISVNSAEPVCSASVSDTKYSREEYLSLIGMAHHKNGQELLQLGKGCITSVDEEVVCKLKLAKTNPESMTETYRNKRIKRIMMECKKLNTYGIFVAKYTNMGASPRIQPLVPTAGNALIACSAELRNVAFLKVKPRLDAFFSPGGRKGILLDLDLQACYVNLLLGLFPEEGRLFGELITRGIWDTIKESFKAKGIEALYKKA